MMMCFKVDFACLEVNSQTELTLLKLNGPKHLMTFSKGIIIV